MLRQLTGTHSKRIAALQQFAAGVAHEIRNPLNTIGMTAQHLRDLFAQNNVKASDIEEARNLLDIVNFEIERLQRISEQFVTLNRPKTLDLKPTDLNALIDQVIAEFKLMIENAKVTVITNYATDLPQLQLDPDLIQQTLFNLIQNSIQAMPKGGRIYITTQPTQTLAGQGIEIEIRDTGVGIPPEIQERVFDAYFTTKESEGGMGLGLALAHQIITAHQGRIELKSQVGMGTAFQIYLPIKSPIAPQPIKP
jgi:signal transduction histidine kinase